MLKAIVLAMPVMLLGGCWDQLELEEQAYVVVLGIDEGEDDQPRITFQIANPQVGSSDKGVAENEPASDTVSILAPDIVAAKELANSIITRKISFSHLKTIVASEAFAKSSSFHRILAASVQDPEMRKETNIIVSKEKALDFIKATKPRLETRPHKYYAFMQQRWKDTGHVPDATLLRYLQRMKGELFLAIYATTERDGRVAEDGESYLAGQVPQKDGDPAQIMGSAVFKGGRMIGYLNGEETRFTLLLRRKALARSFIASFSDPLDPGSRLSVRIIRAGDAEIDVRVGEGRPTVNVNLSIKAQVLSVPSLIDYATNTKHQSILKESLEEQLRRNATAIVERMQREFQSEAFLWHLEARSRFWTLAAYDRYNWEDRFKEAKVNISFEVRIESFGKQLQPPDFRD